MNLTIPVVSQEPGPQYASDINSCLTTIDSHDHSSGKGLQITPAGMNITSDLSFGGNNAIALRSTRFTSQSSPIAGASDLGCLYESGVDLYYNDGSGNQIRLTQSGGIAGTPGSISGLVPPASVTYSAPTFVFQSGVSIAANLDARNIILRNSGAGSFGLTLSPPSSMGADFTITLPSLPGAQSFMTIDASGAIAAPIAYAGGITTSNIAANTILTGNIATGTITLGNINSTSAFPAIKYQEFTTVGSFSFVVPNNITVLGAELVGGAGGGGGGNGSNTNQGGAGAGGQGVNPTFINLSVSGGETLFAVVGGAGAGAAGGGIGNPGGSGGNGTGSFVYRSSTIIAICRGGDGGSGGSGTTGATGGSSVYRGSGLLTGGGNGGDGGGSGTNGATGADGFLGAGGVGGAASSTGGGGGGGGAGRGAGGNGAAANGNAANSLNYGAGGGGGGGGIGNHAGGNGGNGGQGYLRFTWTTWG